MTDERLKRFQSAALRKMLYYAYTVPMYHDKLREASIHPRDIKTIDDIKKLPFLTKDDIRKYSPDKIIPPNFNKKTSIITRTGGTTGGSLSIYFDLLTVTKGMMGLLRALKEYNVDWRKTKMSLLIDLSERSFENEYFINSIFSAIKPLFPQNNIQIFDLFKTSKEVIKKIEEFQPEFIAGYPYAFIQLTILKNKGYGKRISPKCILSSGSFLDISLRKYLEEMFDTKVYDLYAATESGPIAFECKNGNYHVLSDLIYPEFIRDGEHISPGEPGTLVITKLYGRGTPIIRYTGIDDVVSTMENDCSCGLAGSFIRKIHGRKSDSILLPGGKMALPSFIESILSEIVYETKANKILRLQIIQHKLDKLEMKILFDEELRNVGTSSEQIISMIKGKLDKKLGSDIEISISEVNKFDEKEPYFICNVDRNKFIEKNYLV
jgi:phenylacetate-CoA ligase